MTADDRDEWGDLAETDASLRRIVMLVVDGAAPDAVFDAVTKEALRRFGSGTARMIRFEPDGTATILANEGTSGPHVNVGHAWENYPPAGLTATIQRTGAPARVDDYRDIPGGEAYLQEGLRCSAGMPIHVDGHLHVSIRDDGIGRADPRVPDSPACATASRLWAEYSSPQRPKPRNRWHLSVTDHVAALRIW